MDRKKLDDQVAILDSRHAAREPVVFQPYDRGCGAIVLGDVGWRVYLRGKLSLSDLSPEGVWSHPRRAGAACASSFTWLLDLSLLLSPIVKDVPSVANISDAMVYVDTHRSRLGGLCSPASRRGRVCATALCAGTMLLIRLSLLYRGSLY
jgi:hypothetical protein